MKLKKIRKLVWCHEEPFPIQKHDTTGQKIGYRTFKDKFGKTKLPPRLKCPDCKKRFKPRIRSCGDYQCWHVYLPAHKKLV